MDKDCVMSRPSSHNIFTPGAFIFVSAEEFLALTHIKPVELSYEILEELALDGRMGKSNENPPLEPANG